MAEKRSQINNSVGEGSVPSADPEEVWYDKYDLGGHCQLNCKFFSLFPETTNHGDR